MSEFSEQVTREKAEPVEGRGPMSPLLIVMVGALGFFGVDYLLSSYERDPFGYGGDNRTVYVDTRDELDGEALYGQRCSACHQSTGLGVTGAFPPLVASEWVTEDPQTVVRILLLGINGPIEVRGQTYNGQMPAFGDLSDDEIARVATYIRQAWGNQATPVPPQLVTESRGALDGRAQAWNGGAELQSMRDQGASDASDADTTSTSPTSPTAGEGTPAAFTPVRSR